MRDPELMLLHELGALLGRTVEELRATLSEVELVYWVAWLRIRHRG